MLDLFSLDEENTKANAQPNQRSVAGCANQTRCVTLYSFSELRQAFDLFDTDHSGGISAPELKQALQALGVQVSEQEARQMFSAIDIDSK